MSTLHRVLGAHGVGAAGFVILGQVAVALPPGPTDVRAALAALTIPVLGSVLSLSLIAAAEGRKQRQQAEVPVQQCRAVTTQHRKELAR